ncbi:MAG: class I SAM-dependent methyltransferase [Cyclobacteriaceae bacterium]
MDADFDIAASSYDRQFTHSNIGTLQRGKTWQYIDQALNNRKELKILELNCGTGEDALMLAKKGHKVVASDISSNMLGIARGKASEMSIDFLQIDLTNIDTEALDDDFDLVFSNFGGVNCIDHHSLSKLGESVAKILKPNGFFIAVVMPKFCVWEFIYLSLKGKIAQALRRSRGVVIANVSGQPVKTWYYSPKQLSRALGSSYREMMLKPVGFFVPPSYLESFFCKHPIFLKLLGYLEKHFARFAWQARFSDHFFIQYQLK